MVAIDWEEFKEFKRFSQEQDKLKQTVEFIKSYYNISTVYDLFEMLKDDAIGEMLLNKREISDPEDLENFMFKR